MDSSFTSMLLNSTSASILTTAVPQHQLAQIWGFVAILVSVVMFGSNLVPVKKFETGDGVFFQFCLCCAIFTVGMMVHVIRNFPKFYPLAMVGGMLWTTGNLLVIPIIKTVGLGQGILIWASVSLIIGWATGRYGLLGIHTEPPVSDAMNYIGVVLCLCSAVANMSLKTNSQMRVEQVGRDESQPLLMSQPAVNVEVTGNDDTMFFERFSPLTRRIFGSCSAAFAGAMFGVNFIPVIHIQDTVPGASNSGLDYVFAHFCGILLMSLFALAVYCAVKRNRPAIYPQAILPGLVSGVMWGFGQVGWFLANDILSQAISFPIITTLPALLGALWGVFFKEITGKRNFVVLVVAFTFAISGSVLTGLSKVHLGGHTNSSSVTMVY